MSTLTQRSGTARRASSPVRLRQQGPSRQPQLYRHQPVPPFGVDDEGYVVEDSATQNPPHAALLGYLQWALGPRYGDQAFVAADVVLHYRLGDRNAALAPDLLVGFGGGYKGELSYKLWELPVPALVLEVLSESTSKKDLEDKKHTYETLGIDEYWLFDPSGKLAPTPLAGYRLCRKRYANVRANAAGHLASKALGLELRIVEDRSFVKAPSGRTLRFFDPVAGEFLLAQDEANTARRQAEARAVEAEAARQDAEAARQDEEAARQEAEARAAAAEAALQAALAAGKASD